MSWKDKRSCKTKLLFSNKGYKKKQGKKRSWGKQQKDSKRTWKDLNEKGELKKSDYFIKNTKERLWCVKDGISNMKLSDKKNSGEKKWKERKEKSPSRSFATVKWLTSIRRGSNSGKMKGSPCNHSKKTCNHSKETTVWMDSVGFYFLLFFGCFLYLSSQSFYLSQEIDLIKFSRQSAAACISPRKNWHSPRKI